MFEGKPFRKVLRHLPRRVWKFALATDCVLRRSTVSLVEVQAWFGHAVCIFSINSEFLSVFQDVYPFIELLRSGRRRISPAVRQEMWLARQLAFITEVRLDAPYWPVVHIGDSSTYGYALLRTVASHSEQHRAAQGKERWRFHEVDAEAEDLLLDSEFLNAEGGLSPLGCVPPGLEARRRRRRLWLRIVGPGALLSPSPPRPPTVAG